MNTNAIVQSASAATALGDGTRKLLAAIERMLAEAGDRDAYGAATLVIAVCAAIRKDTATTDRDAGTLADLLGGQA